MRIHSHNQPYSDNLARKKRRRFFTKLGLIIVILLAVIIGSGYVVFYSGWTEIRSISINGLKTLTAEQIYPMVNEKLEERSLPILKVKYLKNNLFFNPEPIKETLLANFTIIKNIEIKKDYPHDVNIEIIERTPIGTWCYTENCFYFDEEGMLWGKALKSSGSLLLTVQDERTQPDKFETVDLEFWDKIKNSVSGLNSLGIKTVRTIIPSDSISNFRIYTAKNYYLLFSLENDIATQIDVLRIFLENKAEDFTAQYIDLRIEGRVYYK